MNPGRFAPKRGALAQGSSDAPKQWAFPVGIFHIPVLDFSVNSNGSLQ